MDARIPPRAAAVGNGGGRESCLVLLALGGQALTTGLTVLLAARLPVPEFQAYVVAASLFLLLVGVAPLGSDKLALRVLPPLLRDGDTARVAGFLRFALLRSTLGVGATVAIGLAWTVFAHGGDAATQSALTLSLLAVPVGVLARLGLEAMTAAGLACAATAIIRVAVPALVLVLVGMLLALGLAAGAAAIAAWGAAWFLAVAVMAGASRRRILALLRARPVHETARWRAAARPLWLYRVAMSLQAQSSLLALSWFGRSSTEVGAYAAALAITAPALVLATSTNRAYAREIAMLVDARGLDGLLLRRRRWLLPPLALFLGIAFLFPGPLLAVFRPDFVEEGRWPVRILAIAAAVSIRFSLAPTILKYSDRNAVVFRTLIGMTTLQLVLLAGLVPTFGASGAAVAYALTSALAYLRFAHAARRVPFRSPDRAA